ncbi:MAG: hypothetical protein JWN33_597 [Candidatus Saccharibacteria bacterium]|nr:hypothetical protein [Candidatus Saccharibacteria bacterium]
MSTSEFMSSDDGEPPSPRLGSWLSAEQFNTIDPEYDGLLEQIRREQLEEDRKKDARILGEQATYRAHLLELIDTPTQPINQVKTRTGPIKILRHIFTGASLTS